VAASKSKSGAKRSATSAPAYAGLWSALFRAHFWFDDQIRALLKSQGFYAPSRTEVMFLLLVADGYGTPPALARALGVSRQAVHHTTAKLLEQGVIGLRDDPTATRSKYKSIYIRKTKLSEAVLAGHEHLEEELEKTFGPSEMAHLKRLLRQKWPPPGG
jgi:DNA-binding MarR family transcriptional regulator